VTAESPAGPAPGGEAAPLRLPDPGLLFDVRSARLAALARGHAAPEWLLLLSRIAKGQALAVREIGVAAARAPGGGEIRARGEAALLAGGPLGGPPLALDRLPRDGAWRRMLSVILSAARAPGIPVETENALRRLAAADASEVEAIADAVLAGAVRADRVAAVPFVGAALQAWLAALAARLDPAALARAENACPVCGGPPVAGIVQGSDRFRYVSCAFCATEWHVLRVHCAVCGGQQLEYLHAEGDRGAQAEACRTCSAYVKLFDGEQRPGAEATADDAATIALDLLVADEGFRRAGPNLYVAIGE
jgi:FdhE protein